MFVEILLPYLITLPELPSTVKEPRGVRSPPGDALRVGGKVIEQSVATTSRGVGQDSQVGPNLRRKINRIFLDLRFNFFGCFLKTAQQSFPNF